MPKNRSKRLRKKLHVGEFREFGFEVSFTLSEDLDRETLNGFCDQFLAQAIENNDLLFGGGFGGEDSGGFVTALNRQGSVVTEEHRMLVKNWLTAQPLVADIQIGELIDAWAQ